MVNEKTVEILQAFKNNSNNIEKFNFKLDRVLEPRYKASSLSTRGIDDTKIQKINKSM